MFQLFICVVIIGILTSAGHMLKSANGIEEKCKSKCTPHKVAGQTHDKKCLCDLNIEVKK